MNLYGYMVIGSFKVLPANIISDVFESLVDNNKLFLVATSSTISEGDVGI